MRSVAIFELDGPGASCQCNQLMTKTNAHYRDLRRFHHFTEVIYRVLTMSRVTRTVADENAVETAKCTLDNESKNNITGNSLMCNFVNWIVVWKSCHTGTAANEASKNICPLVNADTSTV